MGQRTEVQYDTQGNVTSRNFYARGATNPLEQVTCTYDEKKRPLRVTDMRGSTDYAYDEKGHVVSVAAPEGTVNYEYEQHYGTEDPCVDGQFRCPLFLRHSWPALCRDGNQAPGPKPLGS